MAVAGIFLAHRENGNVLRVGLDYVVPEYRDHKNGKYVFHHLKDFFKNEGFKKIITFGGPPKHIKYLKKLDFRKNDEGLFEKELL
jgi:hypothetical protein